MKAELKIKQGLPKLSLFWPFPRRVSGLQCEIQRKRRLQGGNERCQRCHGLSGASPACSQLSTPEGRGVGYGPARMGSSSCDKPRAEHPGINHMEWEDTDTSGVCATFCLIPGAAMELPLLPKWPGVGLKPIMGKTSDIRPHVL